jgi:hypothetical protein
MIELLLVLVVVVAIVVGTIIYYYRMPYDELARRFPDSEEDERVYGRNNPELICPHCQTKGLVRTKEIDKKVGISGAKATAAILTAGISVVATGLSRKDKLTKAYCARCKSTWTF